MTPHETEQFAALRMHVAHLHSALAALVAVAGHDPAADGGPSRRDFEGALGVAQVALAESEAEIRDLLRDADRDLALKDALARLAEVYAVSGELEHGLQALKSEGAILVAAARAVVGAWKVSNDTDLDPEAVQRAVECLEKVLPNAG